MYHSDENVDSRGVCGYFGWGYIGTQYCLLNFALTLKFLLNKFIDFKKCGRGLWVVCSWSRVIKKLTKNCCLPSPPFPRYFIWAGKDPGFSVFSKSFLDYCYPQLGFPLVG